MEGSQKKQEQNLYEEWMGLQEQELSQLCQQSLKYCNNNPPTNLDTETTQLLDKIIQHFQDYNEQRHRLARRHVMGFLAPSWCTSFENSMSWIAGCRPSSFFSLVYALCGSDIDSRLLQFLEGGKNDFPRLSPAQLSAIDDLQRRTIMEEEKLTVQMAILQKDLADAPLAQMAQISGPGPSHELSLDTRNAISKIEEAMVSTMEEADQLRLDTVKGLINIFKPVQALDYLIAAKRLRFCIQSWGLERDREHDKE